MKKKLICFINLLFKNVLAFVLIHLKRFLGRIFLICSLKVSCLSIFYRKTFSIGDSACLSFLGKLFFPTVFKIEPPI